MGSDCSLFFARHIHHHISIHAPRMGSDRLARHEAQEPQGFQSTLPGWGATSICRRCPRWHRHFNPRSPDGERLCRQFDELAQLTISIHAPRMGSDGGLVVDGGDLHGFQSTLPGWGATRAQAFERVLDDAISIHAPRMGSDQGRHPPSLPATHFNPRSPDGERLAFLDVPAEPAGISIHAPRMGSDHSDHRIFRA
ncbi:hypothetical protein B5783_1881 [Bifidobacterium breve]|nr:hypothetical protein B5783_1881 [Bifidobacterium breve]